MGFEINSTATLTNVNIRSENHGDDHVPAIDLTLEVDSAPASASWPLLGIGSGLQHRAEQESLQKALWTEEGESKLIGLNNLVSRMSYDDHHYLEGGLVQGEKVPIAKLAKFVIRPISGKRFELKLRVSISEPSDELIEKAVACLKDIVELRISCDAELPLDQAA